MGLTDRGTMQLAGLFLYFLIKITIGNPLNPGCCSSKSVGNESYTLVIKADIKMPTACLESCIYTRDGQNGNSLFCFARGSLPVVCTGALGEVDGEETADDTVLGPFGDLINAKDNFTDESVAFQPITKIEIFTGVNVNVYDAVVGIQATYGSQVAPMKGTSLLKQLAFKGNRTPLMVFSVQSASWTITE